MGNKVSEELYNYILGHMLEIHRSKLGIISEYSLDYDSYINKLNFLNKYIKSLECFLEKASIDSNANELPIVLLGSVVHIRSAQTKQSLAYKIVLPKDYDKSDIDQMEIHSCFSKLGHTLLLKEAGERISLSNGMSGNQYFIEKIVKTA